MCDHVTMSEASADVGVDGAMVPVRDLLPVMVDG